MGNFNDTFGGGMLQAAGNSALGSLIGIATAGWQDRRQLEQQRKLQELQEAGNKRMADYQQKLAMQMWEQTNYPAQVEQLKLAGLNPGLLYGKGGGGGTTANASVGSVSGGSAASGQGEILQGIGLMQQQQQMRLQNAQIKLMEAQAKSANAEADATSGYKKDMAVSQIGLNSVTARKSEEEIKNVIETTKNENLKGLLIQAQTTGQELANYITDESTENQLDKIYYESRSAMMNYKIAKLQYGLNEETYDAAVTTIKANAVGAVLNNTLTQASIEYTKNNTLKVIAEKFRTEAETNKINQDVLNSIEMIAQGWESLEQKGKEIRVNALIGSLNKYSEGGMDWQSTENYLKQKRQLFDNINGILGEGKQWDYDKYLEYKWKKEKNYKPSSKLKFVEKPNL